ncbi:MAG: alcohol dehydrogenase catalytic domain-containing protein [Deltaproteobacteria bacterium]|jgi:L-iditol 2-dehydrogenase|nr:alcohol dehydrogenase catalytic domain-containing protein [Deltaproteobacteria bacterium]
MKVARWYNNQDIRIEEMPTPTPGPDEMLVKVMACGICGSDIVEWYRLPRAPLVPGHELGAEVVETGQSVKKFTAGDRVFVAPKAPCMQCDYCRNGHYPVCTRIKERLPGGLAEYVLVPAALVENGTYRLPEAISYEQSTFIEPLACVVRAQRLAGGPQPGQAVVVFGCGMSGLLHIKLAKANKCRVIAVDVNPGRLKLAAGLKADVTVDAADNVARHLTAATGKKADVVILSTSAMSAVDQAWQCVDKGGAVVFFAVPAPDKQIVAPLNDFWTREIRILTSYYCGPPDIEDAIDLLTSATVTVDDLVTHRLPLEDTARGFQLVLDGQESIKVIITPN